jgi:hypothetical protein
MMTERPDSNYEHSPSHANSTQYHEFLQRKVDAARSSVRDGKGRSNDEVEVEFAARRAQAAQLKEH